MVVAATPQAGSKVKAVRPQTSALHGHCRAKSADFACIPYIVRLIMV